MFQAQLEKYQTLMQAVAALPQCWVLKFQPICFWSN